MAASAQRLLRVLVVDDNRDAADSLATLCTLWGHEVRSAYDGSAIHVVPVFMPDVIVLDIAMPKMNGNKMAQLVRAQDQFKNTLIIAVSGYHDEANRLLSREAGIDHYLIKPVDPSVLQTLLTVKHMALRAAGAGASPS
jgi:DNA-binding response OmpR family regulator